MTAQSSTELNEKQAVQIALMSYITSYMEEYGRSPSYNDIAEHFGISATGVSIDNGGEQIPVTNFKEINLAFDMDQTLVVHHGR